MQTRFTPKQLHDPDIAAAEPILRKCVHCGFCTATCPTYVLLGDELDSPRGRIYLIKDMLEQARPATASVVQHIDRCLSCLACMTTCPSGVHYQHLIDHARVHVERTYRRPFGDRFIRGLLAFVLPYPARFRWALRIGRLAQPLASLLPKRVRAMLALVPRGMGAASVATPVASATPVGAALAATPVGAASAATPVEAALAATPVGAASAATLRRDPSAPPHDSRRVALLAGCVQTVLGPEINAATERVLRRIGFDVVTIEGCCGSIVHHLGREAQNRVLAARVIERLHAAHSARPLAAVIANASGCGTHLKDYNFIFRNDSALAREAEVVSSLTRDIAEFLAAHELPKATIASGLAVAYHSACSMQHGQKIEREPRDLLARAGFVVKDIAEGHLCCGSAGTFNLLQPEIATELRERKLANIARTGATVVATGNIGCMAQLGTTSGLPTVHTVELLDWATGGPTPAGVRAD
jgi:glycolate oxidase iron-sulfur subunit